MEKPPSGPSPKPPSRESSIQRVVSDLPEATKEEILRGKAEIFNDQIFDELKGKERKKTPEELEMIFLANEMTNGVLAKYGLKNFDVPERNFHIIKKEEWPKQIEHLHGFYDASLQGIMMLGRSTNTEFVQTIMHEMLHFKSWNALQITSGDRELTKYRVGLTVVARNGRVMYLNNLNEAVTEEITKRLLKEPSGALSKNPLFTKEISKTRDIIRECSDAKNKEGEPLFNSDTFYATVKSQEGNITHISTAAFAYPRERKVLNILIDKILEKNPEKFIDREEVFEVFARGMMTGNILPMGRLIDGSFGKGTLRRMGELDADIDEQLKLVASL